MFRDKKPPGLRPLDAITPEADARLAGLLLQARQYQQLNRRLHDFVGPSLAPWCRIACLRAGELVILTPTPAWASRLRLMSNEILSRFRKTGHSDIRSLRVRIAPLQGAETASPRRRELTPSAKLSLKRFAEAVDDPELQAIAQRMAGRKGAK